MLSKDLRHPKKTLPADPLSQGSEFVPHLAPVPLPAMDHFQAHNKNEAPSRSSRGATSKLLYGYMIMDIIGLVLGFSLAEFLANTLNLAQHFNNHLAIELGHDPLEMVNLGVLGAGVVLWFQHTGHYRVRKPFWLEVKKVVNILLFAAMIDGFLQFAAKVDFSRLFIMSGWLFGALSIILLRMLMRRMLIKWNLWQIHTLLVGDGATAADTLMALQSDPSLGYEVKAQITDLPSAFAKAGGSWQALCQEYGADYIVIALDGHDLEMASEPMAQLIREFIPFSVSPPRFNLPVMDMVPQYFFNHDVKLLTYHSSLDQPLPRSLKRAFDFIGSLAILLAISPAMLLMILLVKKDGGPAFYGHSRIGYNGRSFACLKFRSMVTNSAKVLEEHLAAHPEHKREWDETFKLKDDPRITGLGKFLRSTSLDELPQLFNVLKGEMSLVGPRPIITAEIEKYEEDIAYYYRVRPGITGLWQVSGRSDVSYPQRVQMDSWYVRNWSLWHDIAILFKTLPALLKQRGAY